MFENMTMRRGPMYDPASVQPMRDELTFVGIEELLSPGAVDEAIAAEGTLFVIVNSVCGCAAGGARPAAALALQHTVIPDRSATVFAGMERDAVDRMRERIGQPPSSPSMAMFRDGELVWFMPRSAIEGYSAEQISAEIRRAFDMFCSRQGPSIAPEQYAQLEHARMCGSKIPRID